MNRPYVTIEIATTGLLQFGHASLDVPRVLEVAMCYDHMGLYPELEETEIHLLIQNDEIKWQNEGAKKKNEHILQLIEGGETDIPICTPTEAKAKIEKFFAEIGKWSGETTFLPAGRKVESFDIPILVLQGIITPELFNSVKAWDVGSMFFSEFFASNGGIPSVGQLAYLLDEEMPTNSLESARVLRTAVKKSLRELTY